MPGAQSALDVHGVPVLEGSAGSDVDEASALSTGSLGSEVVVGSWVDAPGLRVPQLTMSEIENKMRAHLDACFIYESCNIVGVLVARPLPHM